MNIWGIILFVIGVIVTAWCFWKLNMHFAAVVAATFSILTTMYPASAGNPHTFIDAIKSFMLGWGSAFIHTMLIGFLGALVYELIEGAPEIISNLLAKKKKRGQ